MSLIVLPHQLFDFNTSIAGMLIVNIFSHGPLQYCLLLQYINLIHAVVCPVSMYQTIVYSGLDVVHYFM